MSWRFWLLDVPALLLSFWFAAYRVVLIISTVISVSLVLAMLGLAMLGVRWGW